MKHYPNTRGRGVFHPGIGDASYLFKYVGYVCNENKLYISLHTKRLNNAQRNERRQGKVKTTKCNSGKEREEGEQRQ